MHTSTPFISLYSIEMIFMHIAMWGPSYYRTWLAYSKDEPPQKSSRSSCASKLDAPPLVPLESFLARMCIRCMAIPTPHIISIIWHLLPMIVLIDVSLSHPFLSSSPSSLFSILSVNSRAYAHPLHECSKYLKKEWIKLTCTWLVVWGRVKIRFQKKTKCEISRLSSQQINIFSRIPYPPSCTQ